MIGWLLHVGGIDDPTSNWYAFWSGLAGDLPEFAAAILLGRRFNCHARGCWRLGIHRVAGTHYVTCRQHHPDHVDGRAHTAEQIADAARPEGNS